MALTLRTVASFQHNVLMRFVSILTIQIAIIFIHSIDRLLCVMTLCAFCEIECEFINIASVYFSLRKVLVMSTYFVEIKCQLDAADDFYCRSYCLLNMFREPLCPSSGAREYYKSGCCLSYLVLGFQVVGMVWS